MRESIESFVYSVILKMKIPKEYFRHILLYYFRKRKNAAHKMQAHKKVICYIWRSLKESQCRNWFVRFCSENFYVKDTSYLQRDQPKLMRTK